MSLSGIWLPVCSKLAVNWKNDNEVTICWCEFIANFFDVAVFFLSSLVTGPSFMSIWLLVLELWQFSFIRNWPEIRKSEIPQSEFWLISGDCGQLGIPNFSQMSLMKFYCMPQNARVIAVTVFELLRENQQEWWGLPLHPD